MSISEFVQNASLTVAKQTTVSEALIEDTFVKYAKNNGCLALKLILLNIAGWPDRTVLIKGGTIIFIEFKRLGKKLSPVQIKYRDIIQRLGFKYYVCDTIGTAEWILDKCLTNGNQDLTS